MDQIDPIAMGRRLRARRDELGISAKKIGKSLRDKGLRGYSQQNIVSLEQGTIKDPRRQCMDLAGPLRTTVDWLLYEKGPKDVRPKAMTIEEWTEAYPQLAPADLEYFSDALNTALASLKEHKKQASER